MGYGTYVLPDGREAGYLVQATCDGTDRTPTGDQGVVVATACTETVHRGLDALCGESPDGHRPADDPGCGLYFCGRHQEPSDHDCSNPPCGLYSALDPSCCGRKKNHLMPHVDAHTGDSFTLVEGDDEQDDQDDEDDEGLPLPRVLNRYHGNLPDGAVDITRRGPFGNPFAIGRDGDRDEVIAKHAAWLATRPALVERVRAELRGRDLVCVCAPKPCHGDTLLAVANEAAPTGQATGQGSETVEAVTS